MDRREFVRWVGVGFLASSLPVAITACGDRPPSSANTSSDSPNPLTPEPFAIQTPDSEGFIPIGQLSTLDQMGSIENKRFPGGSLIVIRDPKENANLIAINSLCTHQGCTVDWDLDSHTFICPCHGSSFEADGTIKTSPATTNLTVFPVKIEGDTILVKA